MSDLKKLFKKNKNKNKEQEKPLQDNNNVVSNDYDEDLTNTGLVQIQESKEKKPKPVKVQVKQIQQNQINKFQLPGKPQVVERKSWVPQLSGVTEKFDFQKQKQHFVGIGEEYKPPPQPKKGMNNFATLTISEQDKKQNNLIQSNPAVNLTGSKIKFTNNSLNSNNNVGSIQKTAQQIKQQQAEARLQGLKSTPVTKAEKQQREAERKKKQQQSKISENQPKKIVQFTTGSNTSGFKQIEKTAQQIKQDQLEAQLNQLKGKPLTKAEKQQREAQRKKKQQLANQIANKAEQKKVYNFVNNNKVNVQQNKKPVGLSVQQMKQLQLQAKLQKSTPLTKEQAQLQKQKIKAKQQKKKQQQALEQERKKLQAEVPQSKKPRFINSKKVGDQIAYLDLQKPKQKN